MEDTKTQEGSKTPKTQKRGGICRRHFITPSQDYLCSLPDVRLFIIIIVILCKHVLCLYLMTRRLFTEIYSHPVSLDLLTSTGLFPSSHSSLCRFIVRTLFQLSISDSRTRKFLWTSTKNKDVVDIIAVTAPFYTPSWNPTVILPHQWSSC
jgi:hypothetical protein